MIPTRGTLAGLHADLHEPHRPAPGATRPVDATGPRIGVGPLLRAPRADDCNDATNVHSGAWRTHEGIPPSGTVRSDPHLERSDGTGTRGAVLLGRYEVLRRIARGGVGTVYLCRATGDGGFNRLFAVKVLRSHLARDPVASRMFLEEARVAARVYHPHVVGIVDVGRHQGAPFIVMDHVEGGTLHELLGRAPSERPARVVVSIISDALRGLHAVHTLTGDGGAPLGLVHCDISPENLLVGRDGSCRLSDFGSAKAIAANATGAHHGKPAYASPEQLEGRPLDARSDIFSMGVVLFTALTGELLFDEGDVAATVDNVRHKPVPIPSTVGLRPPEPFDQVVLRALARDPGQRYQSAAEMLHDLRRAATAARCLAESTEVAERLRSAFSRETVTHPASGAEYPGLVSPTRNATGPWREHHSSRALPSDERTPAAPRAHRHTLVVALLLVVGILVSGLLWPGELTRAFSFESSGWTTPRSGGTSAHDGEVTR